MQRLVNILSLLSLVIVMIACDGSKTSNAGSETTEQPAEKAERAAFPGEEVTYGTEDMTMKGFLSYDRNRSGQRPGVLVIHEWWGHNDFVRERASQLADMGYVALAVDMYGDGQTADHPDEAAKFAGQVFENIEEGKARFMRAYELLKSNPNVDPNNIAVIGYCFGGTVALNMANAGIELKAVAVFHAGLSFPIKPEGSIEPEILVCNGADDPFIKAEDIDNFKQMMDEAGARYSFINYEGAVHGFTNKEADEFGKRFDMPLAYNEEADEASWREMRKLFTRAFN